MKRRKSANRPTLEVNIKPTAINEAITLLQNVINNENLSGVDSSRKTYHMMQTCILSLTAVQEELDKRDEVINKRLTKLEEVKND